MSSATTPRRAAFAPDSVVVPEPSASMRLARSASESEAADLTGALAQLQLSSLDVQQQRRSALRLHVDIDDDDDDDDDAAGRLNLAPSPLGGSLFAGSDTSYDFDRQSDGGRSADGLSSISPQPSLYSLTDSLRASVLQEEYGHMVNTTSRIYKVASSSMEIEAKRLHGENELYARIMGEFCPGFQEVLADEDDPLRPKTCLDIGCGSGAWILDVAEKFPHVQCTAVDLVPLPESAEIPRNLRFEIDDVSLGLEHFAGDFNVVHVRHLCSGIHDYPKLIDDCVQALRPGGLLELIETDWRVYDLEKRPIIASPTEIWGTQGPPDGWLGTGMGRSQGGPGAPIMARWRRPSPVERASPGPASCYARFFTLARQCVLKRGGHIDAPSLLRTWTEEHRGLRNVVYRDFWVPISGWLMHEEFRRHPSVRNLSNAEITSMLELAALFAEDCIGFMKSSRPLFLATGVPEDLFEEIFTRACEELRGSKATCWVRVCTIYARKRS